MSHCWLSFFSTKVEQFQATFSLLAATFQLLLGIQKIYINQPDWSTLSIICHDQVNLSQIFCESHNPVIIVTVVFFTLSHRAFRSHQTRTGTCFISDLKIEPLIIEYIQNFTQLNEFVNNHDRYSLSGLDLLILKRKFSLRGYEMNFYCFKRWLSLHSV